MADRRSWVPIGRARRESSAPLLPAGCEVVGQLDGGEQPVALDGPRAAQVLPGSPVRCRRQREERVPLDAGESTFDRRTVVGSTSTEDLHDDPGPVRPDRLRRPGEDLGLVGLHVDLQDARRDPGPGDVVVESDQFDRHRLVGDLETVDERVRRVRRLRQVEFGPSVPIGHRRLDDLDVESVRPSDGAGDRRRRRRRLEGVDDRVAEHRGTQVRVEADVGSDVDEADGPGLELEEGQECRGRGGLVGPESLTSQEPLDHRRGRVDDVQRGPTAALGQRDPIGHDRGAVEVRHCRRCPASPGRSQRVDEGTPETVAATPGVTAGRRDGSAPQGGRRTCVTLRTVSSGRAARAAPPVAARSDPGSDHRPVRTAW